MKILKIGNTAFTENQVVSMVHDPITGSEVTTVYLQGGVSHTFSGAEAIVVWKWYITVNEIIEL